MQHFSVKILTTLVLCFPLSNAANILALVPLASPSHHIWNSPLLIALAERGHNVTAITQQKLKEPVANLTELVVTGILETVDDEFDYEEMSEISVTEMNKIFSQFMTVQCRETINHETWKQLMDYPPDTKFDLIIMETAGIECLVLGLSKFGNPPIVTTNAYNTPSWVFEWSGTPNTVSHIPGLLCSSGDRMTFWQRLENLYGVGHLSYIYHYDYLPAMEKMAQERYGTHIPPYSEVVKRISMSLVNFHPVLDHPYATSPSLVSVAGIQIKDPKPLPKDLQEYLDSATEGAVLFSLGSNVKSKNLKPEKKKAIIDALGELPQKILWKFEDDSLRNLPKNIKISKWLPQSDILAHPNVKVFVTHSGLLSTHETIHRGVPVIGIPFLGDQPMNIEKVVRHGAGIRLNYKDITKESLLKAVRTILHDPSYKNNMKELSAKFRDNPLSPLERAVFWTEYVLRHNGAPHFQSAGKDLNILQYYLIDIAAFLIAIPISLVGGLYWLCCRRRTRQNTKQKRN